jgi:hypothetical protein
VTNHDDELAPYEIASDQGIPVELPSGAVHFVITDGEARYLQDKIERYLKDNHFINISDIQDIDKMVVFELMIHRWTLWLSKGRDYFDEDINVKQYADRVSSYSTEVRQLKKSLGVDKATRDRTKGDDSIPALWANLLRRGKEFGVMRNEQFVATITAFQRLKALLQFHDNADEIERRENHCEVDDIMQILREEVRKFDALDEQFRHERQTLWIRQQ